MQIQIDNYPLSLQIGHFQAERTFIRPVLVSLKLETGLAPPSSLEDLEKTVDYGEVFTFLDKKFSGKNFRLLETVLYELAHALVVEFPRIEKLSVSLEKTFMRPKLVKGSRVVLSESFNRAEFL